MLQVAGLRAGLMILSRFVAKISRRRVLRSFKRIYRHITRISFLNKNFKRLKDLIIRFRKRLPNLERVNKFVQFMGKLINKGLRRRVLKQTSPRGITKKISRESQDYERLQMAWVYETYRQIHEECRRSMNKGDALSIDDILENSEMTFRTSGNKSYTTITFSENFLVNLSLFKSKFTYRDPNLGKPAWHPTKPYVKQGPIRGIIHDGASRHFRRFAYDEVNIFGKKYKGSRRASRFPGLGYEPLGKKPKSSARFPKDYRPFIRDQYPGRNTTKDTLSGRLTRIPLFAELYSNQAAVERINKHARDGVRRAFARSTFSSKVARRLGFFEHKPMPTEVFVVQRELDANLRPI